MSEIPSYKSYKQKAGRFGTLTGVFVPNCLTILGTILFLRLGWVVGQAGLVYAIVIIAVANFISFFTGLSLSAISTSMDVRAGGNYYIISRSLGLEIGGAIGIPLYLSQAISVAFYVIGFTEALSTLSCFKSFDPRLIETVVILMFCVIAYVGADFALRIQYVILVGLIAALLSFFLGGWESFISPTLVPHYTEGVNFWVAFAIFFPAVTGIEVGTSLSGDLKDPGKSIPLGTLSSIVVTAFIYFCVAIWFAYHVPFMYLIGDHMAMQRVALWPTLILFGVWASTLSSALGCVLAAPRTLQAISRDSIIPRWMAAQLGSATEPRMAVLITCVIAIVVVWMGDLNFVAPIVTMFFLNTYGMVNLSAGIEKLVGNPSFRPQFEVPWLVSIIGAIGCYSTMFLINKVATVIAIVVSYGIFFLLKRRQLQRTWGDLQSGIWFALSRYALLNLQTKRWHIKNWRPNIVVFTGQPYNRRQLAEVAEWLSLGRGIVTFFQLIIGDISRLMSYDIRNTARKHIQSYIKEHGISAFAGVEVVSSFEDGVLSVVQAHGIDGLEANTVLFGWSGTAEGRIMQINLMRSLVLLRKSVLFLHYSRDRGYGYKRIINVWWRGKGGNADLMLLFAHLIKQHHSWRDANIRLLRVIDSEEGKSDTRNHMENFLKQIRMDAEPVVIVRPDSTKPISEIMQSWSVDADLSLLGVQVPDADGAVEYSKYLDGLVHVMGSVLLVRNAMVEEDLLVTG